MSVAEIVSSQPGANKIIREYGIKFVGKNVTPLESLERAAHVNDLNDEKINEMVKKINGLSTQNLKQDHMISISDDAALELKKLLASKKSKGIKFRLVSSSCELYTYDMDFVSKATSNEIELIENGIKFFIEKKTIDMIKGTRIEYNTDRNGFVINNPNQTPK